MTCPECHAAHARLRDLEQRLGISRRLGAIGAVADHFGCKATGARILLRLYQAGGKPVTGEALCRELSTTSYESMKATVWRIRQEIGEGIIDSLTTRGDGHGYWLTPKGLSRMLAALERPEFQDPTGEAVERPVDIYGMKAVVDPSIPVGEVWIIPTLPRVPLESDEAWNARKMGAAVRLINIGALTRDPDRTEK
jgi:hypothetical protein